MDVLDSFRCSDNTTVKVAVGVPGGIPNAKISHPAGFKAAKVGKAYVQNFFNDPYAPSKGYSFAALVQITLKNGVVQQFAPTNPASTDGECHNFGPYVAGSYTTKAGSNERITGLVAVAGPARSGTTYVQYLNFIADLVC